MKGTSWLQEHLNEFVLPQLGHMPSESETRFFTKEEMAVIKNIWRSVKRASGEKLLVLPGRDVFVFEILARRENFPTLFLPGCSRASVEWFTDKIPKDSFVFDTGFMGTIPSRLNIDDFKLVSYNIRQAKQQVFPHLTMSRSLALKIEKTPKYWLTGRLLDGVFLQDLSLPEEFEKAAQLTMEVYKDSSPSFINRPKPLGGMPWRI